MNPRSEESYGQRGLTPVDRFGVWLSQRAIRRRLPARQDLEVLELGWAVIMATQLRALGDRLKHGTGRGFSAWAPRTAQREAGYTFHEGPIEGNATQQLAAGLFDAVLLISVCWSTCANRRPRSHTTRSGACFGRTGCC